MGPEKEIDELRDNVAAITHEQLEERDERRDVVAGQKDNLVKEESGGSASEQGKRWQEERDGDNELEYWQR
jgi:hypothetical protein